MRYPLVIFLHGIGIGAGGNKRWEPDPEPNQLLPPAQTAEECAADLKYILQILDGAQRAHPA